MRFLIIDDSSADRELIIRRLRREFAQAEFTELYRPDQLDAGIRQGNYDIVLTDYQLNWIDGLQVFHMVHTLYPDISVIMFTGTGSEEIAVEGLRAGLSNYVLKKNLDQLPFAVNESLEKVRLRKQYEDAIEQLRASEERSREIYEQGLTGIFAFTPKGTLSTCNPAFARIFGFGSAAEALQSDMHDLYPDPQQFEAFVDMLQSQQRIAYHELEMCRRNGDAVHVVVNAVGTFDEQGQILEVKGYLFDNTEQRRLESQVQQMQKLESIGLLVSGIAHDFNNMLGGILGYTSRGLGKITEDHPLYINFFHIQDIATRAAKMTQQLLAFSRRQVLEPIDVDPNAIVESVLNFVGKMLGELIEIEVQPEAHLHMVHVDYGKLSRC